LGIMKEVAEQLKNMEKLRKMNKQSNK
jgi:hypothetical protein